MDSPVLKSVDGGLTWTVRGQEMHAPISGLAIDPRNPDIAYATSYTELGLYTTRDGGERWRNWLGRGYPLRLFFEARFTSVLLDPQREGVIHVGTASHGVVTSVDGGWTWKVPVAGLPTGMAVDGLALDATLNRLYVVTYGGLLYSDDDGSTWASIKPATGASDSRGPIAIDAAGSTVYATGTSPGRTLLSAEIGSAPCATPSPTQTPERSPTDIPAPACAGDCDRSGSVTVEELVRSGSIALGEASLAECAPLDVDQSGAVTVDEIVSAVAHALTGC